MTLLSLVDPATHGGRAYGILESARAMVEIRLTERLVDQMERLEAVSTRLARAGVVIGVGGLVFAAVSLGLAAVQVWLALRCAP